jgi:hypothetical protein
MLVEQERLPVLPQYLVRLLELWIEPLRMKLEALAEMKSQL